MKARVLWLSTAVIGGLIGIAAFETRALDAQVMTSQQMPARDAHRHHDRFRGRRGAVIHRGVRHIHAGQQRHLGLELEEILQRALRHLRLVRRVGGQKLAALDQVGKGGS